MFIMENKQEQEAQQKVTPKRYPKPDYCKCNVGHTLMEIFNEKRNCYDWDCPLCKAKMSQTSLFATNEEVGQ